MVKVFPELQDLVGGVQINGEEIVVIVLGRGMVNVEECLEIQQIGELGMDGA